MLDAFTLTAGALPSHALRVLAFTGREAASRCYRFRIDVAVSEALAPDLEDELLGERAVFDLGPVADARAIAGIVRRVEVREALAHDLRAARVELVPRLFRLSLRVTSRIFQDKTVPEIVAAVLDQAGVPHRSALAAKYARRSYCVQHQESDLAFVARLLAEEGIWYWFDGDAQAKGDAGETVVLSDNADLYPPIAGDPKLAYREQDSGARLPEEHHVFGLRAARTLASGAVLCRDYDFRRPGLDLRAEAPEAPKGAAKTAAPGTSRPSVAPPSSSPVAGTPAAPEAELRVYDHHGDDEAPAVDARTARVRLDRLRQRASLARARSACPRLAPGQRFELVDHEVSTLNGAYVVASVEHEGRAGSAGLIGTGDLSEPTYANRITIARATVPLRPEARPRQGRRLQQVTETAIVVGPAGQEVHTDALGRVKVQFHWDLDGKRNDQSSCWLRVATPWAGSGYGFQMVPRVGMEVLVTFLGGDTDRPVVVGCLWNAVHRPPFTLPSDKTRSGLRTRTSPGGSGANELSFEDAAGAEQIYLYAQRDLDEEVKRRRTTVIGEEERTEVRGDQHNEVTGDQHERIGGSRNGEIHKDQSEHVFGNVTERVEQDRTSEIGGNRMVRVNGTSKETVEGDAVLLYRDGRAVHVEGHAGTTVGTHGDAAKSDFYVFGDHVSGAEGNLTLVAKKSLTLQCGDSVISLTPGGLKIGAKSLALSGAEGASLKGKGPALNLGDDAEIVAKAVKIFSQGASLELGKDAHLRGARVLLNCDTATPPEEDPSTGRRKTKPLKVKLSDVALAATAGKKFKLLVDGNAYEGTTGADGTVTQEIPEGATSATVMVWPDGYPEGSCRQWNLSLKDLAPPTSPAGVALRLRNLGYHSGVVSDDIKALPEPIVQALKDFQKDHGLTATGQLDGATSAKLQEVYGH